MVDTSQIEIGQIVQIRNGRLAGSFAIVIEKKDRFVWLVDGKSRTVDHPKKKNVKHIQPTKTVVKEVANVLDQFGSVDNSVIRYALNQYQNPTERKNVEGE